MMFLEFTTWDIVRNLLVGAQWTIVLSLLAFVLGGLVGLALLFVRISRYRFLQWTVHAYVEVFQGTPLLMQLFILFFGLALLEVNVSAWAAAAIGLTLFTSAYLVEIWRGCVEAIPKGQWESAETLAFSYTEQMRYIILPQALRIAIPPTVGFSVQVVKGTSVASIIGFTELTRTGSMLANATFAPFLVFGLVAIGYFLLCYPLSLYARHLEKRFHVPG